MNTQMHNPSMGTQRGYGDNINSLPTDETVLSHNEMNIVETLFKKKHTTIQKLLSGAKETVLLAILFVVFSLPQLDAFLRGIITSAESPYILVGIKALLFASAYFIIKNMYLVRKK